MTNEQWVELVKLIPSLLWFLFWFVLTCILLPTIRRDLLPRLSGLKVFGVEFAFLRSQLDLAVEHQGAHVSENDRVQVLRRAAAANRILAGLRVLWVDDHPENNRLEVSLLKSLGIVVEQITSTGQAVDRLARNNFDAVISDIARDGDETAGLQMVKEMWNKHLYRWTVFYVGTWDASKGTPPFAFGITNRPDHLLHFLIDIAERERL